MGWKKRLKFEKTEKAEKGLKRLRGVSKSTMTIHRATDRVVSWFILEIWKYFEKLKMIITQFKIMKFQFLNLKKFKEVKLRSDYFWKGISVLKIVETHILTQIDLIFIVSFWYIYIGKKSKFSFHHIFNNKFYPTSTV